MCGEIWKIGNNVFIGGGAKIIGDIKIGDNVTIAPNAVVVKDVNKNCIVGGVPSKVIGMNVF
jgi:serine O-acetyltransferase